MEICKTEAPSRQPKHMELDGAFQSIIGVKEHAQNLISKISHGPRGEGPNEIGVDKKAPTLLEVLEQGPEFVRSECDAIRRALDEIDALLF